MVRSPAAKNQGDAPQVAPGTPFETALSELEQLVQDMESGKLSLEASIAAYQKGSALLAHCQSQLDDAERKIHVLENGMLRELESRDEDAPCQ